MKLVIDSLGDQVVARKLLAIADRAVDVEPAMRSISDQIMLSERKQFDSQGGYGSGGWEPLAPSTVRTKARRGLDPRILRATGDLAESLTNRGGANLSIPRHDGLDFGSTVPYARFHQQGNGVPVRKPAQFPERDRRAWAKTLQRFVIEGDTGRGGLFR